MVQYEISNHDKYKLRNKQEKHRRKTLPKANVNRLLPDPRNTRVGERESLANGSTKEGSYPPTSARGGGHCGEEEQHARKRPGQGEEKKERAYDFQGREERSPISGAFDLRSARESGAARRRRSRKFRDAGGHIISTEGKIVMWYLFLLYIS